MPPLNHQTMVLGNVDKIRNKPERTKNISSSNKEESQDNNRKIMKSLRRRVSRSGNVQANSKKKRRHLVEQHFKIDEDNRALLPGVPSYDDDLARDIHDFFNLIFLVPIILLNILNWNWDLLTSTNHFTNSLPFENCWTGDYFDLFFNTTVSYFVIDLIWVLVVPRAVKSPSTIVQHHIASLLYLTLPYQIVELRFLFGVCMSVEINTWFLIARRVFNKQGFPPWTIDLPYLFSVRVKLISICFYVTWIAIRIILYPYVLVIFYGIRQNSPESDHGKYLIPIAACLHMVFCFLNARWTLDLVNSKIRQWRTKSTKIQSGL